MSITVGRYTFNSWLRRGVGTRIAEVDNLGAGVTPVKERPTIPIDVTLNTETIHKDFALVGPGDIIGINPAMVVRTEPLHLITNFEPNYLPFVEFYDEDFVWRYTPARANDRRLRPWLALLVLEEHEDPAQSEFERHDRRFPLPTVTVHAAAALPPPEQTWAWAHVHINEGYNTPSEFEKFLLSLHDLNHPNADKIICRLMSPRKLRADRAYRALVVPAFETGRLAGMGQDPSTIDAQKPSWTAGAANVEFPIYYEWYFRTGQAEDFESLVDLILPRPVDKQVGIRDMDGSAPGFGMTQGTDIGIIEPVPPATTARQEIVGLEGALKAPTTTSRPKTIDTSKAFFAELQSILNFPAELQEASNAQTDPVVCPPIYGENHARRHVVAVTSNGWLNELNRDPRNRVPSGFGTKVVQTHQEDYVARAWAQVKRILDLNRGVQLSVFAMSAVEAIHRGFVSRLTPAETMAVFSPVLKKVKGSPTTLHHQLSTSTVPPAAVDGALRRMIRPRGAYGRRLRRDDGKFSYTTLVNDLNEERVSAAPPKPVPPHLNTDKGLTDRLPELPAWLAWLIRHRRLVLILVLVLLLVIGLFTGAWLTVAALAAAAVAALVAASRLERSQDAAASVSDPKEVLHDIQRVPRRPGFKLRLIDPVGPLPSVGGTQVTTGTATTSSSANAIAFNTVTLFTPGPGGGESLEAANFRAAATRLNERLTISPPERKLARFDLVNAYAKLSHEIDPGVAFPKQLAGRFHFEFDPGWLKLRERLVPAMAYPDFQDAMYAKLRDISSELFLPNLQLIPPNTISLLVTNPPFIESYMVGLNHEFGRELLWREYPTDRRGSYFRQFWEVKGIISDDATKSAEELADVYKDIAPLDEWPLASELGQHPNPKRPQNKNLVLVIRGELLKKYPNTIIYAQRAHIYRKRDGGADPTHPPIIVEPETEADMKAEIRFPIFRAEIDPDFRFFGFELTIEEARGAANPQLPTDDWGWYFVIQEVPGEPRFGMDVRYSPDQDSMTPITWDDLSWTNLPDGLSFIGTSTLPDPSFFNLLAAPLQAQWGRDSADMAFILYQKPVMIAVHAVEMLEKL
jgi:hypothetical protein